MMHPLTGPVNDGSTPLCLASGAPPVCIRSTMAPSSPESNKASLSPFLLSKKACKAEKHEKSGAKKVHRMMPRASNDGLGRIDTSTLCAADGGGPRGPARGLVATTRTDGHCGRVVSGTDRAFLRQRGDLHEAVGHGVERAAPVGAEPEELCRPRY